MPWPSKDPADYRTQGAWEGRPPPRWVQWVTRDSPWWLGMAFGLVGLGFVILQIVEPEDEPISAWWYLIIPVSWIVRALRARREQTKS